MCDGGRDRDGIELVEYCDKRFLDAWDIGRGKVLLRDGGEVINGGSGGCDALGVCDEIAGGEVAGEEPGDIIAVMAGDAEVLRAGPRPGSEGLIAVDCAGAGRGTGLSRRRRP